MKNPFKDICDSTYIWDRQFCTLTVPYCNDQSLHDVKQQILAYSATQNLKVHLINNCYTKTLIVEVCK